LQKIVSRPGGFVTADAISQIHAKINDEYAIFHSILSIFILKDIAKQLLNLFEIILLKVILCLLSI
jgi:hypothetical protein